MPQLRNLIAPELETYRLRHSKAVDVEDSAAHAELGDVIDHLDPLESDRLEASCKIFRSPRVAFSDHEARLIQLVRELSLLEKGAGGSKKNRDFTPADALERLDALACNLGVWLYLAEAFAWRIKC